MCIVLASQCFKVRALKLEKAFKDLGHEVSLNKEKPRKGAVSTSQILISYHNILISLPFMYMYSLW